MNGDGLQSIQHRNFLHFPQSHALFGLAADRAPHRFQHIRLNHRRILVKRISDSFPSGRTGRTDEIGPLLSEIPDMGIPPMIDMGYKEGGKQRNFLDGFQLIQTETAAHGSAPGGWISADSPLPPLFRHMRIY